MKKRDIIIVTLSVAVAIVCIALTFWGNLKNNGVLTIDAYIGVIASLIGVCATIVVGFQIASFLELREVKKQVEVIEKERATMTELKNNINMTRHVLTNSLLAIANSTKDPLDSLAMRIMSIVCEDINTVESDITIQRYKLLKNELLSYPENIRAAMTFFIGSLKQMSIPNTINNYVEIAKLHYEVISIIDNANISEMEKEIKK